MDKDVLDMNPKQQIVIVTGMHRSGTSLCSHVLSTMGYDMADVRTANPGNAKGHWERWELVAFHDRILGLFDRGWFGPNHAHNLPEAWWTDPRVRAIRNEMIAWLRVRRADISRWGFKDPRTANLIPLWDEICHELGLQPRYVLCVRHPSAVIGSLQARDALPLRQSLHRWLVYNARLVSGLSCRTVCILPYDWWFEPETRNPTLLASYLELEELLDSDVVSRAIASIVDPGLRHHQPPASDGSVTGRMYDELVAAVETGVIGKEVSGIARLFSDFADLTHHIQERAECTIQLEADLAGADARAADLAQQQEISRAELTAALAAEQGASAAARDAAVIAQAELDRRKAEVITLQDELQALHAAVDMGNQQAACEAEQVRRELQDKIGMHGEQIAQLQARSGELYATLEAERQAAMAQAAHLTQLQANASADTARIAELEARSGELAATLEAERQAAAAQAAHLTQLQANASADTARVAELEGAKTTLQSAARLHAVRNSELEKVEAELRAALEKETARVQRLWTKFPPSPGLWGRTRRTWT